MTNADWDQDIDAGASGTGGCATVLPANPEAAALLAAVTAEGARSPRLDAGAVEKLSAAALQVLLCVMKAAQLAGSPVVILNPSFAFSLAFEAYGFGTDNEPFTVEYS